MRFLKTALILMVVLQMAGQVFAQKRNSQWELFAGGAVPLAPEFFKDFFEVGISIHGQHVMFPSPKLGVSIGAAYETFTTKISSNAKLEIGEVGVGLRPYLSSIESNLQIFLFGMATYDLLRVTAGSFENDEQKFGLAFGGGLEFPAGPRFNIILQAVARNIFTEDESTSFLGITGGLVF